MKEADKQVIDKRIEDFKAKYAHWSESPTATAIRKTAGETVCGGGECGSSGCSTSCSGSGCDASVHAPQVR